MDIEISGSVCECVCADTSTHTKQALFYSSAKWGLTVLSGKRLLSSPTHYLHRETITKGKRMVPLLLLKAKGVSSRHNTWNCGGHPAPLEWKGESDPLHSALVLYSSPNCPGLTSLKLPAPLEPIQEDAIIPTERQLFP